MKTALQKLLKDRQKLLEEFQIVRDETIVEAGSFDDRVYQEKLARRGLPGQLKIIDYQIECVRAMIKVIGDDSK
ncbi:MAG TPA: hypothetical protein PLA25_08080 [Anaerolineaceae bacterium]|nr:hypothetical protein [Anaerolineaceae bacterium]